SRVTATWCQTPRSAGFGLAVKLLKYRLADDVEPAGAAWEFEWMPKSPPPPLYVNKSPRLTVLDKYHSSTVTAPAPRSNVAPSGMRTRPAPANPPDLPSPVVALLCPSVTLR